MVLTEKQKQKLEGAILEYLNNSDYKKTYEIFKEECINPNPPNNPKLLEQKWKAIPRLEMKIQDHEKTIKRLEKELTNVNPNSNIFMKNKRNIDAIPTEMARQLLGHRSAITRVRFHPSFGICVTASEDATIKVWDPTTGSLEKTIKAHTDVVKDVCFHPDGTKLASCSSDLSIKLWDFQNPEFPCLRTFVGHDHTVSQVVFCMHGTYLISCSRDFTIRIWETDTAYCTKTLTLHTDWVNMLTSSPSTSYFASSGLDKIIRIWDAKNGKCITDIRGFDQHVECIEFSLPKTDEIIGAEEKLVQGENEGLPSFIAVGGRDRCVELFSCLGGEKIMRFKGHNNWVRELVFHPNGKFLISCSDDRSIRIWDLKKKRCQYTLENVHEKSITSCDFQFNPPLFLTGGVDRSVKVWSVS